MFEPNSSCRLATLPLRDGAVEVEYPCRDERWELLPCFPGRFARLRLEREDSVCNVSVC
jgi:hypothetical protein